MVTVTIHSKNRVRRIVQYENNMSKAKLEVPTFTFMLHNSERDEDGAAGLLSANI